MKKLLLILSIFLFFIACNKNKQINSLDGRYNGTFNRTGMDTVAVDITFVGNLYDGYSTRTKYPAICNGSFELNKNTVVFHDSCVWTADFDWTLILDGEYKIQFDDERTVRIWRENGSIKDEYLLFRLIR
jgi:hypothetical protein